MADLKWKYVSPLKEGTEVEAAEMKYHFKLPEDLRVCLTKHNAGVPSLSTFDFGENKEMVFGGLLSFNKDDLDCFYDYVSLFERADGKGLKMFPFALDPAGNFFCVKDNKIVLYNHETDETIAICETFTQFLDMLY